MSFAVLAAAGPWLSRERWLSQAGFFLIAGLAFLKVSSYALRQKRLGQLVDGPASPGQFPAPGVYGWLFAAVIIALLFLQSALYMVLIVMGLSLFLAASGRTADRQFGLRKVGPIHLFAWSLVVCLAVVFVELPLGELIDQGMTAIHLPHPEQISVEMMRRAQKPDDIMVFILGTVVIGPLFEELFFRGFLYPFLKNFTSTGFALVLSAGIFAFAHANLGAVIQLWVLGLVLGLAYEHTGSLLVPMCIHGCWNLFTAISLLLERGGF